MFAHSATRVLVRMGTDDCQGDLGYSQSSIPMVFTGAKIRALSNSLTPNLANRVFMDSTLCRVTGSILEQFVATVWGKNYKWVW